MSTETVSLSKSAGIARITIDRQSKLNALNIEVLEGLAEAFEDARIDDDIRVVVLTGAGDKAFVAGADISELQDLDPSGAVALVRRGHRLFSSISQLGKPVIAAIGGYALGGGCELALACTLRIASDRALMGLPEVKLGLIPGYGGTQRLARLVGSGRALHLMLTGDPVNAAQALDMGLVTQVVEHELLAESVDKLAGKLAAGAPLAMASIMTAVSEGQGVELERGLKIEEEQFVKVCTSEDMTEGTSAFLEKRPANFKGR